MKKSTYLGKTFTATVLEPEVNTGLMVVCYPGSGEAFGPADGSRLAAIKYGFSEAVEWPFTIVKVQTIGTNNFASWQEIQSYIEDHCSAAVLIGWSLGSKEVMDLLLGFLGRKLSSKVKLAVAIDGPASGNPDYSKASVPVIMISGNKGLYYYPLKTQERALLAAGRQVTFVEMDNLDHSGLMQFAYSSQNILNNILSLVGNAPTELNIVSTTVKNNVITFTDSKGDKYTIPVTRL